MRWPRTLFSVYPPPPQSLPIHWLSPEVINGCGPVLHHSYLRPAISSVSCTICICVCLCVRSFFFCMCVCVVIWLWCFSDQIMAVAFRVWVCQRKPQLRHPKRKAFEHEAPIFLRQLHSDSYNLNRIARCLFRVSPAPGSACWLESINCEFIAALVAYIYIYIYVHRWRTRGGRVLGWRLNGSRTFFLCVFFRLVYYYNHVVSCNSNGHSDCM